MASGTEGFGDETRLPLTAFRGGRALALLLFAVTLFTSAFLLFQVQLIMGALLLPKLGGTPQVWNTCMVFFQTALLAGYAYTHLMSWTWKSKKALEIGRAHV